MQKNIIIIGLGSMMRRRVRCLRYLGYNNIWGVDINPKRRSEIETTLGITCYDSLESALTNRSYDYMLICTPPHCHDIFIEKAIEYNIPTFVEASVLNHNFDRYIQTSYTKDLIIMASSTLWFHPAIQIINDIIQNNKIGKISNVTYHCGQNLNDWHPYEDIRNYYVSIKEVGGCREIVPFELTWITKVFGFPIKVYGNVKQTVELAPGVDIDDVYIITMDYGSWCFNLIVDVVSRPAIRELVATGDIGQIRWNWNDRHVDLYEKHDLQKIEFNMPAAAEGYNKNITEGMYIEELRSFLEVKYREDLTNNLYYDQQVLNLLYKAEQSNQKAQQLEFRNVGILINVKLGSTRLSNKHLKVIDGRTCLEWLLLRTQHCIKFLGIDARIVVVSSNQVKSDELVTITKLCDVEIYYGDDANIPKRHLECAKFYGFTHIISLDGDDLVTSRLVLEKLFAELPNSTNQMIRTEGMPLGMNAALYSTNYLCKMVCKNILKMTTGWHRIFDKIKTIQVANYDNQKFRFTLDYSEDLDFFNNVIRNLNNNDWIHPIYEVRIGNFIEANELSIICFVEKNHLNLLNRHMTEEYWENFNRELNN